MTAHWNICDKIESDRTYSAERGVLSTLEAPPVSELAAQVQEVHVAFNNNRSHYAPKAALALKQSLQAR